MRWAAARETMSWRWARVRGVVAWVLGEAVPTRMAMVEGMYHG